MSGPPAGVQLSPQQITAFKEAGVRNTFIVDLSAGFGPFIMGYVCLLSPYLHINMDGADEQILLQSYITGRLDGSSMALVFMDR